MGGRGLVTFAAMVEIFRPSRTEPHYERCPPSYRPSWFSRFDVTPKRLLR